MRIRKQCLEPRAFIDQRIVVAMNQHSEPHDLKKICPTIPDVLSLRHSRVNKESAKNGGREGAMSSSSTDTNDNHSSNNTNHVNSSSDTSTKLYW